MTVKELYDYLTWFMETNSEMTDYPVVMVGHDANGERLYDIPVADAGFNSSDGVLRLWDR